MTPQYWQPWCPIPAFGAPAARGALHLWHASRRAQFQLAHLLQHQSRLERIESRVSFRKSCRFVNGEGLRLRLLRQLRSGLRLRLRSRRAEGRNMPF